ncbi:acyltransferase family protein [Variovorax sp. LG9.2]|uniref:acyltransferase family protein n=1 Tax=Variovorax sp. LG9.2 TaxID=3048626 RepID=UPI002B2306D9|nr:acyltransferase family protein [Variovorax sp. LG9.2]MEB0055535.1 acyltransferase family protein [Variovorax sp. LG9.2]
MPPQQQELPHLAHPKYRPDIDGLRAVAVLAVVVYHAFPEAVRGGFIGVDIFFVISGYLISTIIFGSLAGSGFSYGEFYARRIRRILPALLPVMAATWVVGWYVLLSDEFRELGKHLLASAGFVSNLALWNEAGYFDTAAESKPLLHLWSLAVEEQFYIFWPLFLGLVWRARASLGRNKLTWWIGIAAGLSFVLNVATIHRHPEAVFYSPLSRIWELAAGALLAHSALRLTTPRGAINSEVRVLAGLVLIGLGLYFIQKEKTFPGWWAILPVLGACLCISAGPLTWLGRNLLGSRVFVWFGLISYPLYLWHWPLLAYARIVENGMPTAAIRGGAVVAAIVLAWLTYRFLERPIRKSNDPAIVRWLLIGMVTLAVVGTAIFARLIPARNSDPTLQAIASASTDWGYPDTMQLVKRGGEEIYKIGAGSKRVLLLGDSHIEQYGPRAVELARAGPRQLATLYFATRGSCPAIPHVFEDRQPECAERRDRMEAFARSADVDAVVIGGCWACYFDVGDQPAPPSASGQDHYYFRDGDARHLLRGGDGVERSLDALDAFLKSLKAAGKKTYLVLNIPVGEIFEPKSMIRGSRLGTLAVPSIDPRVALTASQKRIHDRLEQIAVDSGAVVLDPMATLCNSDGKCLRTDAKGIPIYKDLTHLRATYVRQSATFMDEAITQPN